MADVNQLSTPQTYNLGSHAAIDERISMVASHQHGIVTARQLASVGLGSSSVAQRVRSGRLHRVHRGVYAVGHPSMSRSARWMAAVLAAGAGAALARQSAAALWELPTWGRQLCEVVVPRSHNGLSGLSVVQSRTLVADDVVVRTGIRTTSVARTLVDLGEVLADFQLAKVMDEAAFKRRLSIAKLEQCIARNHGRHGIGVVRRALDLHTTGSAGVRSRLESRFLSMVTDAGLPVPLVNTRLPVVGGTLEVDFHWPDHLLCAEVDGAGHGRAQTRHEDRRRDARLRRVGLTVVRYGESAIRGTPATVIADLRSRLG